MYLKEWSKHWFVLSGTSLRFFKDSQAEEANEEDGRIDIASCYDVSETDVTRNYGFRLRVRTTRGLLKHIQGAHAGLTKSSICFSVCKTLQSLILGLAACTNISQNSHTYIHLWLSHSVKLDKL